MNWIVLGVYYEEEDFGSLQMHPDVFHCWASTEEAAARLGEAAVKDGLFTEYRILPIRDGEPLKRNFDRWL
jgi:hypothetical protein